MFYFLNCPLEQFIVLPIDNLLPIFFNNFLLTFIFIFLIRTIILLAYKGNSTILNLNLIPLIEQKAFEKFFLFIFDLISSNLLAQNRQKFFPILATIFIFILNLNIFGLIPYSFTITSSFIMTFSFSLFIFLGIQIISLRFHKTEFLSLFFPSGVSTALALILVPIELISFFLNLLV